MSFYQKVKNFTWKYQIILACSATAAATYVVVQDVNAKEILKEMAESLASLSSEYDDVALENLTLHAFLDSKNLQDEFLEFAKKGAT